MTTESGSLAMHVRAIEGAWGVRPVVKLACSGFEDEHWQLFHPDDYGQPEAMPRFYIKDGVCEPHPL